MANIYIVEDDSSILEIETIALKSSGHEVRGFDNGGDFMKAVADQAPDLVILDIMLPDMDGFDILRNLRNNKATKRLPVIMVTAKTAEIDLVRGLDSGADDYMKKPFSVIELITRVKALLRRAEPVDESIFTVADIVLDDVRHRVTVAGEPVPMTFKEFELLKYLMRNPNIVLSREKIMSHVWEMDFEGESRTVDMHIKFIRKKLGDAGKHIRTVRNVGYVIDEEPEA